MAGRSAVGLDIGTCGVRAAQVTLGKGPATLERFGQVALPSGAVRDGEVADVGAVASAIRQLWARTKFGTKKVVVGVANQKVIVRQVDLPWLPPAELRGSLAFQVQDYVPMPVDQAILDFHPLHEFRGDDGTRMVRVLLVAAARDMVNPLVEAVTRAGLTPAMVDLTSFAVLRALAELDELGLDSAAAEALVDVGARVTNIVVHQGGVPRFVRILLMGGSDITEAIAERMGVAFEQAESAKFATAITGASDHAEHHLVRQVIEATAGAFAEEVRGSLDYYLAQPSAARLGRIVVCGGGGQLAGLTERLSVATRLPVVAGSPMRAMKLGRTGLTREQLAYLTPLSSVPVGLALGMAA